MEKFGKPLKSVASGFWNKSPSMQLIFIMSSKGVFMKSVSR
jgi:hypothetical protein